VKQSVIFGYCFFVAFFALLLWIPGVQPAVAAEPAGFVDIVDREQAEKVIQGKKDDIPLIDYDTVISIDKKQEQLSEVLIDAATWLDSL